MGSQRTASSIARRSRSPVLPHRVEQRGIREQRDEQDPELPPGRARPRGQDEAGEAVDLVVGQQVALAVLRDLALDEHRDHVVLRLGATLVDHVPQHRGRAFEARGPVVQVGVVTPAFGRVLTEVERLLAG